MIFENRKNAGELLASRLQKYKNTNSVILALPRGGVPIAADIAKSLNLPMDVLIVRKIGAPFNSELAVGAICETDEPVLNPQILAKVGIQPEDINGALTKEKKEVDRQVKEFRQGHAMIDISNKMAIIVDDGMATGATVKAAIKYLKKKGTSKIIVAVPVSSSSAARAIRDRADDFITVQESDNLGSVGKWYNDFGQVSDEEVKKILTSSLEERAVSHSRNVDISVGKIKLEGLLTSFPDMKSMIIFAHGSGSSRKSPRNLQVSRDLNKAGFGTLLFDLLTEKESGDRSNVFDIDFLSQRLVAATKWLLQQKEMQNVKIAYFGASTGAAAALQAAAKFTENKDVYAVVSRGGRPDLAGKALDQVRLPTLLLVGSYDRDVLELNRIAQKHLTNSKLSIVEGATHLFEEPGTLEQVSKKAAEWFSSCLVSRKASQRTYQKEATHQSLTESLSDPTEIEQALDKSMFKINQEEDLDALIDSVKDKRVVMLGESTHGTLEFYRIRALISKRLIKDHGFKFIAVEGDWPDAYRLHRYIQTGIGTNAKSILLKNRRWPTWMWANEEIIKLVEWMRRHKTGFYGLDVYSLFESIDEVNSYLKSNKISFADEVAKRYACFEPYQRNEIAYARSLMKMPAGCESAVLLNLQKMLNVRIKDVSRNGDELFSAKQNAHTIANAESYYRAMLSSDPSSWNIRDTHMMETLDRLLDRSGEGGKAIVWAHNTHIGDYRATDMKEKGYVNLGGLARMSYGDDNVALVGFGSYQGEVLASSSWDGEEKIMTLPAAKEGTYESYLHQSAIKHNANQFYFMMPEDSQSAFAQRLGHRAVGVVYDPAHENRSQYVPTILNKRYNSFVFVDRSHALKSLHSEFTHAEFPETWPTGL